jgi:oxygen-independent coproporphyrinogen-3 oxidase
MQEWVGVGPSASSQFAGRRHTNVPSLDGWLAGLDAGRPARVDVVDLSDALLAVDALVFGLRMNAGVDVAELRARIPSFDWNAVDRVARELSAEDLAALEGTRLRLTRRGRLLADQVAVHIMEALETAQESPGGALGMMPGAGA